MSNIPLLLMYLEAPLQSYGENSKWDYRDTSLIPTKSSIVGLIACAMGVPRDDNRLIELSKSIKIGVRVDRKGTILREFQTITGELYTAEGELWGSKSKPIKTKLSFRQYLEDACFLVAIEGSEEVINQIEEALKSPKWQIFLGRKTCVPSRPVLECITTEYDSLEYAIKSYPLCNRADKGAIVYQVEDLCGNVYRYDETLAKVGISYGRRAVKQSVI